MVERAQGGARKRTSWFAAPSGQLVTLCPAIESAVDCATDGAAEDTT